MWAVAFAMTVLLAACVENTASAPPPVSEAPTVTIKDMRFMADHVTIEESDTVTWVWEDDMPHDVSGDGFESEVQSEGTFTHTFNEAGSYRYVCSLHSGMKGTVTVIDA
jgi:plastocyanin